MASERNALAELANDLGNADDGPSSESICKAQRIVAELAKVYELGEKEATKENFLNYQKALAMLKTKCRAIAEEGAGDGK